MSRVPKIPVIRWHVVQLFTGRLDKIRMRNALADARRAQAARLLAQQVGPPFDWNRITLPREGRNAAIGG